MDQIGEMKNEVKMMTASNEDVKTRTGAITEGGSQVESSKQVESPKLKLESAVSPPPQPPTPNTQHPTPDTQHPAPAEATEQGVTRFAAAVAHELQQPLAVIRNAVYFLNMYMGEHLDEKVRKHMSMIWYATDVASNGVADLLCFAEHKTPEPVEADVGLLVLDAWSRVRVPNRIRVKTAIDDTLPAIQVDPMQVVRVLANLITNAVDSMPETGSLTIIGTTKLSDVIIEVTDTGVGIPAEDLPRVFEPFFTTKSDGKGLGLVIVDRLTKLNGGQVAIASEPGKGTTVKLTFPLYRKTGEKSETTDPVSSEENG